MTIYSVNKQEIETIHNPNENNRFGCRGLCPGRIIVRNTGKKLIDGCKVILK